MAKVLREFINLDYDRKTIHEARENKMPILLSGILQRADTKNQNGRIYPRSVLEREIENYQKAVAEGRAVGECVPTGTEIFTPSGWRNIEDVQTGDPAFTLNTETNEIEIQQVTGIVDKQSSSDLIRFSNSRNSIDMTVTEGHLICLWDRNGTYYTLTAKELADALARNDSRVSHSCIRRGGVWRGQTEPFFTIPGSEYKIPISTWASFLGIYLAEGHVCGTRGGKQINVVGISQTKPDTKELVRNLLQKTPFKWVERNNQFTCCDKHLAAHLRWLGNSWEKHIPQYAKEWEPAALHEMLTWMLIGDGRNRLDRKGNLINELATTSSRLASDTQEIMLKLGSAASSYTVYAQDRAIGERTILASNSKPLHIVHQHTAKAAYLDARYTKVERIKYSGRVHCVRTPNKTWLMRQNNVVCWTHNCDHPNESVVSLKNVSHIVREIGWNGNDVRGKVEILGTPSGLILQNLMEAGVRLGISSRGVGDVRVDESGADVVDESFVLIAFDVVSEPSTQGAWLKESRNVNIDEIYNKLSKRDRINRIANEILRA